MSWMTIFFCVYYFCSALDALATVGDFIKPCAYYLSSVWSPVAQVGNFWNSSQSYTIFLQQVQPFFKSWKIGAPGW